MSPDRFRLRDAREDDSAELIDLIGGVYGEYPGCVLDVDGEVPHLRRPASAFTAWSGHLWVMEDGGEGGRIVACVGFSDGGRSLELRQLYVDSAARRQGLGERLCGLVEDAARRLGRREVELWTDTRFGDARRLYERLGYVRTGRTRELDDRSRTVEYQYRKGLQPSPT